MDNFEKISDVSGSGDQIPMARSPIESDDSKSQPSKPFRFGSSPSFEEKPSTPAQINCLIPYKTSTPLPFQTPTSSHQEALHTPSSNSTFTIMDEPLPLFSSSRLNDSFDSMNISELKTTLEETRLENMSLREELERKDRQLRSTRMKVKVLMDLDASMEGLDMRNYGEHLHSEEDPSQLLNLPQIVSDQGHDTKSFLNSFETLGNNKNIELAGQTAETVALPASVANAEAVTNNNPALNILPVNTFILIREITSRIEIQEVRERVIHGIHHSHQFGLGGIAGWIFAFLVKNYGKTALTALGGGVVLLSIATKKGFVEVNWNNVLTEIQRTNESQQQLINQSSENHSAVNLQDDWTVGKIQDAKKWLNEHCKGADINGKFLHFFKSVALAVAGFASGFLYSVL